MNRPLGLTDPNSATATVDFAPSGTDIGAASEPRAVSTQPGCTEFTLMSVSLEFRCQMNREYIDCSFRCVVSELARRRDRALLPWLKRQRPNDAGEVDNSETTACKALSGPLVERRTEPSKPENVASVVILGLPNICTAFSATGWMTQPTGRPESGNFLCAYGSAGHWRDWQYGHWRCRGKCNRQRFVAKVDSNTRDVPNATQRIGPKAVSNRT